MWSWRRDCLFRMSKKSEERKEKERRERAFIENGSKLLEKLLVTCNDKSIPIRSFSAQELQLATNNYKNHLRKQWYKGYLEGRSFFVKAIPDNKIWADFAINDLVMSAQMSSHKNVLKPIGCCLETQSPILVYESAMNGFLTDRIYMSHDTRQQHQPMEWSSRLKVARQIAHAISYLHTAFSRPVIHMAIHMRNILLDEHDVPKLDHFFYSVSIPEGEIDVEVYDGLWNVYFNPPELEATGKVTEKSDVYYFGELLLELLTGEKSYDITRLAIDKYSSLIAHIHTCAQACCISEIVDPAIFSGKGDVSLEQQLQAVLDLALTCTEEDPQRRPTMVHVTKELRRIER
ncbi:serine/threonine-protein kinase ZRK1-like [Castanea sativa]|uniref:serine/threonine-protein kinase ZRK1-like n=1 Tax=Castanea sativa TaxID=21020 RepID=UPI003F64E76D